MGGGRGSCGEWPTHPEMPRSGDCFQPHHHPSCRSHRANGARREPATGRFPLVLAHRQHAPMTHSFARRNPSSSHCVQHCPSIRAPDWLPTITRTACGVRIHSPIPFQLPQFRILPSNQYSGTEQHRTILGGTERAWAGGRAGRGGRGTAGKYRGMGCNPRRPRRPRRPGGWVPGEGMRCPGERGRVGGQAGTRQDGRSGSRFQGDSAGAGWDAWPTH